MDKRSSLLDVACSTGFSSREVALLTGCSGIGFDSSLNAIEMARYNKIHYAPKISIEYQIADGYEFRPKKKFTHVFVGGNLAFFSKPGKMLNRCLDMLQNNGNILATPYYMIRQMPKNLIARTHKLLGIPLNSFSRFKYKDVMSVYNGLDVLYEDRNLLIEESEAEIKEYCNCVISRACNILHIDDQLVFDRMYKKLLGYRKIINEGRPYQAYSVLVLRYRKSVYPQRYIPFY